MFWLPCPVLLLLTVLPGLGTWGFKEEGRWYATPCVKNKKVSIDIHGPSYWSNLVHLYWKWLLKENLVFAHIILSRGLSFSVLTNSAFRSCYLLDNRVSLLSFSLSHFNSKCWGSPPALEQTNLFVITVPRDQNTSFPFFLQPIYFPFQNTSSSYQFWTADNTLDVPPNLDQAFCPKSTAFTLFQPTPN